MKKIFMLFCLFCISTAGITQFIPQPLNFPEPGYWPYYYSITDPDHVWVGTFHESGWPTGFSVKTTDGGNFWIFDTIPAPGNPTCVSISGYDSNTCFFTFFDMSGVNDPSVWKTTDGGLNWNNIITDQFGESFINFYHAFSADTGLAMGDPKDGYFEIQLTDDGGLTWSRVDSADIPAIMDGEMGLTNSFSAVGNSIWFTTNKCRVFRSNDKGHEWNVAEILPGGELDMGICFSNEQKGAVWINQRKSCTLKITSDGGITWDTVPFPEGYWINDMSRVDGFDGGFILTGYKTTTRVWFTPDLFTNLQIVDPAIMSNGAIEFYDAETGWLGGGESGENEIYKFTGILTSAKEALKDPDHIKIVPNPSDDEAMIKLPSGYDFLTLIITDISGREVFRKEVSTSSGWAKLDPSVLPGGIYVISVYSEKELIGRERWSIR